MELLTSHLTVSIFIQLRSDLIYAAVIDDALALVLCTGLNMHKLTDCDTQGTHSTAGEGEPVLQRHV
jgi:hypothetical protein